MKLDFLITVYIFIFLGLCFTFQTYSQTKFQTHFNSHTLSKTAYSTIDFEKKEHHFGKVKEGSIVKHHFVFYNNGNNQLLITNVTTTCGCTAISWPRHPIRSFEKGEIVVEFDTHGKQGLQNKVITVYSNTPNYQTFLKIKAVVSKH